MLSDIMYSQFFVKRRSLLLLINDLIIVLMAYFIALLIKNDFSVTNTLMRHVFTFTGATLVMIIIASHILFFYVFKIHKSLWNYLSGTELWNIIVSVILASICVSICLLVVHIPIAFTGIIIIAAAISILAMFGIRLAYRAFRDYEMHKHLKYRGRRALIVGAGNAGYLLMKELQKNVRFNAKLIGFIDDYHEGMVVSGYAVLGKIENLPTIVSKKEIEIVFIAMPSAPTKTIQKVIEICKVLNVETKIMSPGEELVESKTKNQIRDVAIEDLLGRGVTKLSNHEISEYIHGETVLVTGAAGSIGGQLCLEIFKFIPKKLLLLDINENGLYMLEQELIRLKRESKKYQGIEIKSLIVSIREKEALRSVFEEYNIDVVYHAAAHKHVPLMETRPQEAIKNNIVGTRNVIDTAMEYKAKRFIMISTDKAVNPTNVMGASKRMTELILQSRGNHPHTKIAAVRFGNVLGSNGSVIPIFKKQIENGGPITLTSKKIIRYFMTIPEATQLVLQAGYYADNGEIFVLDMGEPVRILDLAENLIRLSGLTPYKDIDIIEIGLRPGEKMFEELQYSLEKTHKTTNEMIMVNEIIHVDRQKVDKKVDELLSLCQEPVNKEKLKAVLFEAIDIQGVICE